MLGDARIRRLIPIMPTLGIALGAFFFCKEILSFSLYSLDLDISFLISFFPPKNHLNLCTLFLSYWLILFSHCYSKAYSRILAGLSLFFLGLLAVYFLRADYGQIAFSYGSLYFYFATTGYSQILYYLDGALSLWIATRFTNKTIIPKAESYLDKFFPVLWEKMRNGGFAYALLMHVTLAAVSLSRSLPGLTKTIPSGADWPQYMWNFWWFKESLFVKGTNPFFSDYIFAAANTSNSLLFHTYVSFWGLFSVPFQYLAGNPAGLALAYNGAQFIGMVTSGVGSYYLAGLATRSRVARLVASLIPPFFIFSQAHASQLNYGFTGLIPFQFAFIVVAFRDDPKKFKWAVAFLALQVYAGLTYALYMLMFSMFVFCFYAIKKRKWPLPIPHTARGILLGLVMLLPIFVSALKLDLKFTGHYRWDPIRITIRRATDPANFLVPEPRAVFGGAKSYPVALIDEYHHHFSRAAYKNREPGTRFPSHIFLGIAPIVLAFWGIAKNRSGDGYLWGSAAAFFFILSLGPRLLLGGNVFEHVVLPYAIIHSFPPLSMAKTPVTYMVPCIYAMLYFVSRGAESLLHAKKLTVTAILLLVFLDQFKMARPPHEIVVPEYCSFLSDQEGDFLVLDLPAPRNIPQNEFYMYYQTLHGKRIWWGFLARGVKTKNHNPNPAASKPFDGPIECVKHLQAHPELRTKFIVVHKSSTPLNELDAWKQLPRSVAVAFEDEYAIVLENTNFREK